MGGSDIKAQELRQALSSLLAGYFVIHLKAELLKSADLVDRITSTGITFRRTTEDLISNVRAEFPDMKEDHGFNIVEEWVARRDTPVPYADSTFRSYNHPFFARLLDIRDGTAESRGRLRDGIQHLLSTGNFYGTQITFKVFFHAENVMREL